MINNIAPVTKTALGHADSKGIKISQLKQVALDLRNLRDEWDNGTLEMGATAGYLDKAMNAVLAASEAHALHCEQEEEKRNGTT